MSSSGMGSGSARSASYAASATSSRSTASRRPRAHRENQDGAGDEIFESSSSLETGIFGVLCTLRKENSEARIRIRWVLLKILLDVWQLFTLIIDPAKQGWSINANGPAWTFVSVFNFKWISDVGYECYLALLYIMVGALGLHVGLCLWVAWCFKEQKFPVLWPLKVLRLSSSVFFQAFDVAALNLLELGFTCHYTGDKTYKLRFDLFPQYSCSSNPHIMHAVVSGLCLGLFVAIALLTIMAEVEVNLLSRRPFALGNSSPVVIAFAFKVLLTLVRVFIGWQRVGACLYLALSIAFAWQFVRWNPHLVNWVNYLRSGVAAIVVWCSGALTLLVFHPGIKQQDLETWADSMTLLMLLGLAPAFGAGACMSWGMIRHMTKVTLQELRNAKPGAPLGDICMSMDDPRDVEIVARCCRVWKDRYTVEPAAMDEARRVIQAGVAMFPNSPFMVLLQANFMIDVMHVSQRGSRRIEEARKLNPGIMCRFIMFIRQQHASQHAAGNQSKGGGSMDLLAYVEYQRKQRMVIRLHREALQAMCNFWRGLDSSRVSFTHLSKALGKIETSVSQAQTAYRVVLESHGNNPKLVRLYGRFLQTIKNDPWRATEYFTEADRLEEIQSGDAGGPLLPDGTPLGRMDEIATAVLVISASGEVQMANRHAHVLFGYKRGSLEGNPMATLLAPHNARWLAEHLSYLVTRSELLAAVGDGGQGPEGGGGGSEAFRDTGLVVGMHSERLAFSVKLAMRKASGVGEDSTFIAMMEVVPPVKGVASLWVAHNGTIVACDPQFVMAFGWKSNEVNGSTIASLLEVQGPTSATPLEAGVSLDDDSDEAAGAAAPLAHPTVVSPSEAMMNRLLHYVRSSGSGVPSAGSREGARCLLAHKYDSDPVPCTVSVVNTGILDASVYEIKIRMDDAYLGRQMLVVNRKGTVLHSSAELLTSLTSLSNGGGGFGGSGATPFGGSPLFMKPGPNSYLPGAAAAGGGGAAGSAAAALGPVGLVGVDQLAAYTLMDFLPSPWKEMHFKYLRATTSQSPARRSPITCRKDGPLGPTLELRTAGGRPLYMNVSVSTADVTGETNHVIQMARSSREAAVGERRLRLQTTQDGVISVVAEGSAARLFGLDGCQLTGRALWDIIDWSPHVVSGNLPAEGPLMVTALIKRELTEPGRCWRVQVSAPAATVNTSLAGQTALEIMVAARVAAAKPAVLQVHVELPANASAGSGEATFFVDLWFLDSVTGVLEVDGVGRVRAVLEEHTRPAGLLFGVATQSLVGCMLGTLVTLPLGRSRPGDLLSLHGAKKSSLKATTVESSVKVGPVHVLQGSHSDGQMNALDVQVIGKHGTDQHAYVILRRHATPMLPAGRMPVPAPAAPTFIPAGGAFQAAEASSMRRAPAAVGSAVPRHPVAAGPGSGARAPGLQEGLTSGVLRVSTTPPAGLPLQRGVLEAGKISPTFLDADDEDMAVTIIQAPPLPEGLLSPGGLGGGLPVPTVVNPAAALLSGRGKLVDLVRSMEDHRGGAGGISRKVTAGRSGGSGGSSADDLARQLTPTTAESAERGGKQGGVSSPLLPGEGGDLAARSQALVAAATIPGSFSMSRDATAADGDQKRPKLEVDVESVGGESDELHGAVGSTGGGKERISTWVASQGVYYQNSVIADKAKGDDDDDGGQPRMGEDLLGGALRSVDLKALLRKGSAAAAAGEDEDDMAAISRHHAVDAAAGAASGDSRGGDGQRRPLDKTPDYPDDDAASEGGMSAMSGQSAGDGGADYKRGKRFRKLMKLMDSGQAHQVQRQYRFHALATVGMLAIVHIVFFALTIYAISTKRDSMLLLGRSGQAQRYMHEILTNVRALDIISKNKTQPNLYTREDAPALIRRIAIGAQAVQARFKELLDSHHSSGSTVRDLLFYSSRRVWDGKDIDGSDTFTNLTIWDFTTRFAALATNVEQHGSQWVQDGVAVVDNTTAGQFLIKSGPDLWRASRQVLDGLLYAAVDDARWVNNLQIAFLCVEGVAITSVAAFYLAYLLRAVAAQRYTLYSTFMLIPLGLTRALAAQNTNLSFDEEDEDVDDDADDKPLLTSEDQDASAAAAAASTAAPKLKRRAILAVFDSKRGGAMDEGGSGGRGSILTSPKSVGNRAQSFRTRSGQPSQQQQFGIDALNSSNNRVDGTRIYGALSRVARRLRQLFIRRGSRIAPLLGLSAAGGEGAAPKRKLKYDSHETVWLLMPFISWSALVIAIYAFVVAQMRDIVDVLAVHSVVNFIAARTYRAVFYCQELASSDDASQLAPRRAAVAAVWKVVRDAWITLQLGKDAYKATGPSTERFPLVKSGLAYSSPVLAHVFYGSDQCHRDQDSRPCPGPDYRFYLTIRGGLDSIMHQFMMHVEALGFSKSPVAPGLNDEHLDFIYNVGTKDLMDGTGEIQAAHLDTIMSLFHKLLVVHIILLVLFFVIFGWFLIFLLNPLLTRISRERRRVAELLSQLPLELDVVKLVARAVGAAAGGAPAAGAGGGGLEGFGAAGHQAGGEAALNGLPVQSDAASEAVTKWKNIIRSASALQGNLQSGSINSRRGP